MQHINICHEHQFLLVISNGDDNQRRQMYRHVLSLKLQNHRNQPEAEIGLRCTIHPGGHSNLHTIQHTDTKFRLLLRQRAEDLHHREAHFMASFVG